MKKTIITCAILSVLNGISNAASTSTPNPTEPQPVNSTSTTTTNTEVKAITTTPSTTTTTTVTTPAAVVTSTSDVVPEKIDCEYHLSPQLTEVAHPLIKKWTEKAVEQSFSFDSALLDAQIEKLKACFTAPGWQGFYDALKKSGNLTAITNQGLTVSAMVDGESTLTQNKPAEWKLNIPLQVVYQNKQQKLTQALSLEVLVGRKPSGDLGIMQIVAVPKTAPAGSTTTSTETQSTTTTTTPSSTTQPSTTPAPAATPTDTQTSTGSETQKPVSAEPSTAKPVSTPANPTPPGSMP